MHGDHPYAQFGHGSSIVSTSFPNMCANYYPSDYPDNFVVKEYGGIHGRKGSVSFAGFGVFPLCCIY